MLFNQFLKGHKALSKSNNLSKAGSTQDASQLWIQTPEQSSSPTRMAATGNLETINSSQQEQLSNN
jgi:hypothetical protein